MVRFRNAVSCVLVVAMAAGLCTGCSRSKFSCDSDNLMGFEGYYYEDGELYVVYCDSETIGAFKTSEYTLAE